MCFFFFCTNRCNKFVSKSFAYKSCRQHFIVFPKTVWIFVNCCLFAYYVTFLNKLHRKKHFTNIFSEYDLSVNKRIITAILHIQVSRDSHILAEKDSRTSPGFRKQDHHYRSKGIASLQQRANRENIATKLGKSPCRRTETGSS